MNTKALCLTTLALLCSATANAQCGSVCGDACCDTGCYSGCNDGCNAGCQNSIYSCQDWCGGACCNGGKSFSLGLTQCNSCPGGIGCQPDSCLTSSCCSHCSTKAFPDAGWAPPARYPVNRSGVWYHNWQPQTAYGNPGGGFIGNYPQVFAPNDTTQLGYYYAKVPTWQSAQRIPPAPRPSAFHNRACPGACGPCNYGGYGHGHWSTGGYYNSGCPSGNCQSAAVYPQVRPAATQPSVIPAVARTPATQKKQVIRTASAKKKGIFNFSSLRYLFD